MKIQTTVSTILQDPNRLALVGKTQKTFTDCLMYGLSICVFMSSSGVYAFESDYSAWGINTEVSGWGYSDEYATAEQILRQAGVDIRGGA